MRWRAGAWTICPSPSMSTNCGRVSACIWPMPAGPKAHASPWTRPAGTLWPSVRAERSCGRPLRQAGCWSAPALMRRCSRRCPAGSWTGTSKREPRWSPAVASISMFRRGPACNSPISGPWAEMNTCSGSRALRRKARRKCCASILA